MSTETENLDQPEVEATPELFTWRKLKAVVNQLDEKHLDKQVYWWGEEEGGRFTGIDQLQEDYLQTDEGFVPRSVLQTATDEFENDPVQFEEDYPLAHEKGTPIFYNF